jgi:5-formyltetrahydrofolate cyclo-ligase
VNKSEIRKKILKIRKQKSFKNLNINCENILKILKKNKIKDKLVGGYHPYNHEVDAMKILQKLERKGYQISLPKIKKNFQMNFFNWSKNEPLKINKYGIPEPISANVVYPDILLIPLSAFDNRLYRIGYGGGYYDRYIKKIKKRKKIITIGLAYSFQRVKKIPINKHDVKLDYVVTD